MEGPLLVIKSWALTAMALWIYRRWFQQVAAPSPDFEAFCTERPVVAALHALAGDEARAGELLKRSLGRRQEVIATLGAYPWPHYCLKLAIEVVPGAVLLRVVGARVMCSHETNLPALATLVRDALNELPNDAAAWIHPGTFSNGLVATPEGGWAISRGIEKRPKLQALSDAERPNLLRLREPDALFFAAWDRVNDAVPRIAS
jgi:hypothetical protein